MKKVIILLFISVICINTMACSKVEPDKPKIVSVAKIEEIVYGPNDIGTVKKKLKDYGKKEDLEIEKAIKKDMVVIDNKEIVGNENIWNEFYENCNKNKEGSVTLLKYTAQGDPIVTYLSYCDKQFLMVEDNTRNRYLEGDKDYNEYVFKYLRIFEDDNFKYAYLLDDKDITLEGFNYYLSSQNSADWIPYGFIFYIHK